MYIFRITKDIASILSVFSWLCLSCVKYIYRTFFLFYCETYTTYIPRKVLFSFLVKLVTVSLLLSLLSEDVYVAVSFEASTLSGRCHAKNVSDKRVRVNYKKHISFPETADWYPTFLFLNVSPSATSNIPTTW